jgi:hypothetical protein
MKPKDTKCNKSNINDMKAAKLLTVRIQLEREAGANNSQLNPESDIRAAETE